MPGPPAAGGGSPSRGAALRGGPGAQRGVRVSVPGRFYLLRSGSDVRAGMGGCCCCCCRVLFFLLFFAVLLFCTFLTGCGAAGPGAAGSSRAGSGPVPVLRLRSSPACAPAELRAGGVRVPPDPQHGGDTSLTPIFPARCSCEAKHLALVTGEGCAADI